MNAYRVTKYNPGRRDRWGAYPDDDWIHVSQLGEVFSGRVLSVREYLAIESAYVQVACILWESAGRPMLRIEGSADEIGLLEPRDLSSALPNLDVDQSSFEGMKITSVAQVELFIRLALRSLAWGRLESDEGFYIHFSWDMHMYVGGIHASADLIRHAQLLGIFVEECPSPVV